MPRPLSANEYGMGYRIHVAPLFLPESPPPSPPPPTYFEMVNQAGFRRSSSFQRMAHSVDCDLPQLLAEKLKEFPTSDGHHQEKAVSSNGLYERNPLLIPTISIDGDAQTRAVGFHRPSLTSIASFAPSETNSFSISLDKGHYATTRVQRLVSAFTERARALKERIAQPATPSTDASSQDGREAPRPPPIRLRLDSVPIEVGSTNKKFRFPSTFHPLSSFYIGWLFVVTTAFFYNLWCVPVRTCFPYQNAENTHQWLIVDYMADVIYFIDTFFVRPRLRFVNDGVWVNDVVECRKNYIRTRGFKADVVSLIPLDLLYFYFGPNTPLLRIPRMIRILPFWELFDRLDVVVSSPFIIRVCRTLFYLLYLIHLNACAYYLFSEAVGIGGDSFVFQGDGNAYVRCFYFAMKTSTKIGKNPKPVNNIDRTFMIFNWLIGVFACAAILGQMRDIMAAADKNINHYREQIDRTVQFMNRLHLPHHVQNRVRTWFSYSWSTQKTLDEQAALVTLSSNMQLDIALNVHFQTLSKVQLFQDCDQGLLRDLVLKLKPVLYQPMDLVCKKGEVGKEMYIVKSGQVQVLGGPTNDTVLVTLGEGSVFGEISLLAVGGGNRRMADVRSKGFSNLFVLSKSDLNEALHDHPEAQKILQTKAKKLVKKTSRRKFDEEASKPIIEPQSKPATPKLVKAVLRAISPNSKASHLLLRGSRTNLQSLSNMENECSTPSISIEQTTCAIVEKNQISDECLKLQPEQFEMTKKIPRLSQAKMLFPGFSNRIAPVNDEDPTSNSN